MLEFCSFSFNCQIRITVLNYNVLTTHGMPPIFPKFPLGLSSLILFSADDINLGLNKWTGILCKFQHILVILIGEPWKCP